MHVSCPADLDIRMAGPVRALNLPPEQRNMIRAVALHVLRKLVKKKNKSARSTSDM
jgi:hypothetical protein